MIRHICRISCALLLTVRDCDILFKADLEMEFGKSYHREVLELSLPNNIISTCCLNAYAAYMLVIEPAYFQHNYIVGAYAKPGPETCCYWMIFLTCRNGYCLHSLWLEPVYIVIPVGKPHILKASCLDVVDAVHPGEVQVVFVIRR